MKLVNKRPLRDYIMYTAIIIGGIILDQLTKILTFTFMELGESIPIINGVIHLTYIQNEGAAFGMMADQRWIFIVISTIAIIGFSLYLYLGHATGVLYGISLSMVISGGIGNMIDRLAYGYVVDFIHCKFVKYPDFSFGTLDWYEFPIFNGADSFVCVGAGMLIFVLIREIIDEAKKTKSGKGSKK